MGLGRVLVQMGEGLAAGLGHEKLFLWTFPHLVKWYEDMGWNRIEQLSYLGYDAHVMHKSLEPKPFELPSLVELPEFKTVVSD
jgi:hypothetical protein